MGCGCRNRCDAGDLDDQLRLVHASRRSVACGIGAAGGIHCVKTILVVTNIPTPYRLPLFAAIDDRLRRHGRRLFVLFGSRNPIGRRWDVDFSGYRFDCDFCDGPRLQLPGNDEVTFTYRGLLARVRREQPELVVTNGFGPSTMKMWLDSYLVPRRFAIWSGAIDDGSSPLSAVRRRRRRAMLQGTVGSIAYGAAAQEYLIGLGQPARDIHVALNTVDTTFFDGRRCVTPQQFTFIYVGDLKPGKGVEL